MNKNDRILSDLIKKSMYRIEDESFTKDILRMHLSRQKKSTYKPFPNFGLLITGISSVIISIGLIISVKTKTELIKGFVLTEEYGLVLLVISLVFLVSVWMESFTTPKGNAPGKI
jgi:hypothetical protein